MSTLSLHYCWVAFVPLPVAGSVLPASCLLYGIHSLCGILHHVHVVPNSANVPSWGRARPFLTRKISSWPALAQTALKVLKSDCVLAQIGLNVHRR